MSENLSTVARRTVARPTGIARRLESLKLVYEQKRAMPRLQLGDGQGKYQMDLRFCHLGGMIILVPRQRECVTFTP